MVATVSVTDDSQCLGRVVATSLGADSFASMGFWGSVRDALFGAKAEVPVVRPEAAPLAAAAPAARLAPAASTAAPRVKRAERDFSASRIIDLKHLEAVDLRVVGTAYVVRDNERAALASEDYLLVLEPENDHDCNAVAVYSGPRKVGYLSAKKAASYAPVLRSIAADAFRVGATSREGKSAFVLLLPKLPSLRAFAAGR